MSREQRIFVGIMTASLILGCRQKQAEQASAGGASAPLAYAPEDAAPAPAALRQLVSGASSSGYAAAPDDGVDSGRALFDGARLDGGPEIPVNYAAAPASGRGAAAASVPRRARLAASSAPRERSRGLAAPPLPDDPALLKSASARAGADARGAGAALLGFAADQLARGYAVVYPIISRAGWHAVRRRGAPVPMRPTHVTIHHTDGPQTMTEADTIAAVRSIQRFHMKERGWDDIAYHFLIDGEGRVIEGRPVETLGAHVLGGNANNIGIAMMGDFEKQHPTPAQVESLTRLVAYLAVKYKENPATQDFVQPHRHYNNTDCPGKNMMAIFAKLRRDIDGETEQILAQEKAEPGRFQPVAVVGTVGA